MEQNKTLQELLTEFCNTCWNYECETQQRKYDTLSASFENLSIKEKLDIIPQLVDGSKIYPSLIFLAQKLFNTLSTKEQHCLTIDLVFPSSIDDRHICRKEFSWRVKHNYPCTEKYEIYFRPVSVLDLKGFKANIEMISASDSPCLISID